MALEMKQGLKQAQTLSLSPQIQQAIKILLLSRQELETVVAEELRENPVLEEVDASVELQEPAPFSDDMGASCPDGFAQIENSMERVEGSEDVRGVDELLSRFAESLAPGDEHSLEKSEERELPGYELYDTKHVSLHEELEEQLNMMHLTPYELECALLLLQYLDDDGLITTPLPEIVAAHQVALDDLEYALSQLQLCEPLGVGARSLQESLLLQLGRFPQAPSLARDILEKCWSDFEKQDVNRLARALKAKPEDVKKALGFIKSKLDPRPARQFGGDTSVSVTPDVYVFKRDDNWVVSLNEEGLPRIRIAPQYESLLEEMVKARTKGDKDGAGLKSFLNEKVKNARWVVRALYERNKTILRVTEVIVEKQQEFFEHGLEHLRPLTLKVISEALGLHESTISRTTTNKYLHCPRGVFELKFFFNAGVGGEGGDEGPANETVKSWVAEYIRNEAADGILSDQEIADRIQKEKNVKIARRTVAKYRENLGILPSSKRARLRMNE